MSKIADRKLIGAFMLAVILGVPPRANARIWDCGRLLRNTVLSLRLKNKSVDELLQMYSELLPIARGVTDSSFHEVLNAHDKILRIGLHLNSFPERTPSEQTRLDEADILLHEPIARIEEFKKGGFNRAYLVQFANGKMAVFKPFLGQKNFFTPSQMWRHRIAFTREVSATWIVEDFLGNAAARKAGVSPLELPVTEEVLLVHKGVSYGVGSIQMYVDGFASSREHMERSGLENRIRTIDYLLGNPDRLANYDFGSHYAAPNYSNIMRDHLTGKRVFLVDNAFGRPGPPDFSRKYAPPVERIPADLAQAILNFDESRFRETYRNFLPAEGLDDFVMRVRILRSELKKRRRQ